MMRVMFLLPGAAFRKETLESWSDTMYYFLKNKIPFAYRTFYSSDIYMCRNGIMTLGSAPEEKWEDVVPFGGEEYDYIFWIDSDTEWKPEQVVQLLSHGKDIVSGVVPIGTDVRAPMGYYGEDKDGKKALQYIDVRQVKNHPRDGDLLDVHFVGGAFLAVKQGVMEAIGYPWFRQQIMEHGGRRLICSEDVGWCKLAREAGFTINVDPTVVVRHIKPMSITAQGPISSEDANAGLALSGGDNGSIVRRIGADAPSQ